MGYYFEDWADFRRDMENEEWENSENYASRYSWSPRSVLPGYEGNPDDVHRCIADAQTTTDVETMKALVDHWNVEVRLNLVFNRNLSEQLFLRLAQEDYAPIRTYVAKSKGAPTYVLEHLMNMDPSPYVREEARINLGVGIERREPSVREGPKQ